MRSSGLGFALGLCLLTLSVPLEWCPPETRFSDQKSAGEESAGTSFPSIPPLPGCRYPHYPGYVDILADTDQTERMVRERLRGYRRITAKNILDHETRRTVYDLICAYPGVDLAGLATLSGANEKTLKYHLDRISEEHLITTITIGKSMHFFENHARYSDDEQQFLSRFSSGQSGRILQTIRDHPGITRGDLARMLGVASPTVTRTVQHLARDGYIRLEKEGRYTKHYLPGQSIAMVHRFIPA